MRGKKLVCSESKTRKALDAYPPRLCPCVIFRETGSGRRRRKERVLSVWESQILSSAHQRLLIRSGENLRAVSLGPTDLDTRGRLRGKQEEGGLKCENKQAGGRRLDTVVESGDASGFEESTQRIPILLLGAPMVQAQDTVTLSLQFLQAFGLSN